MAARAAQRAGADHHRGRGSSSGTLLSGSIIVETVFAWPGSGSLLIAAIQARDYPLITGTVLTYTIAFVAINFLIDILYAVIDPRIRFGSSPSLEAAAVDAPPAVRASRRRRGAIRAWLTPKIVVGGGIVLLLVVAGALAPWISPYDPNAQNLAMTLQAAAMAVRCRMRSARTRSGRDILSRLFYGARVSLVIAVMVVVISGVVGIGLGAVSGYFAGATDFAIQKLVEVVWAFPPLLLAIAIMAFLGQGLDNLILALVSQRWITYCRVPAARRCRCAPASSSTPRGRWARATLASSCTTSCPTCCSRRW